MTAADAEFLGIQLSADGSPALLPVTTLLCTPIGFLYGGSGVAACAVAAEAATGRSLMWITTQYVANAFPGEIVELRVDIVAEGRATSQTHVHGTVGDRTVLHATTAHSNRDPEDAMAWGTMPQVSPPEDSERFAPRFARPAASSMTDVLERRIPPEQPELSTTGRAAVWTRVTGWPIGSPASQGFVADVLPIALSLALGRDQGGTSLDNTVRIVRDEPIDGWILLDVEAEGFHRSIGFGRVRLWRPDGTLIGVGTQSCIVRTSHHPT